MSTQTNLRAVACIRLVRRRHYTFDALPDHRKREAVAMLRKRAEARLRYAGEERPYEWAEWFAGLVKWKLYSSEAGMIVDVGAWGCIEAEALKKAPEMRFFQHTLSAANAGAVAPPPQIPDSTNDAPGG